MDFHDYVRAVRRNIALILVAIVACGVLGVGYLAVAPRKYDATASLLLAANDPSTVSDANTGALLAKSSAETAAALIGSPVVLSGVADDLAGKFTVAQLSDSITTTVRTETTIVDVDAQAGSAADAQAIANATAQRASDILPSILAGVSQLGTTSLRVYVVQSADVPGDPTSPSRTGVIGIALLVGLCVGIALAILRYTLDTRVRDRDDVRALRLPAIGELPRPSRRDADMIPTRDSPGSAAGEAYRNLRTNVLSYVPDESATVVLAPVASPHDISVIVASLAWSMAETLRSTVVVDLDVRTPGIERVLGLPAGPGVTDVLAGRSELERAIRGTANDRLFSLGAGTALGRPQDLLASAQLGTLLADLESRFELVIVRAPALSMYTDATLIARWANISMLVVRVGRDRSTDVAAADSAITTAAQAPIGTVLDGVRPRRRRLMGSRTRIVAPPIEEQHAVLVEELVPGMLVTDDRVQRPSGVRRKRPMDDDS